MKALRLMAFAVAALATYKIIEAAARSARRGKKDSSLDAALDDTFPASDPTATQDFSIPANRQ